MSTLFPCIPIFGVFFGVKGCEKWCVCVCMCACACACAWVCVCVCACVCVCVIALKSPCHLLFMFVNS